ncbi:MAG: hypothetical protein GY701_02635 [Sulfitobacter sp.]|nr:hypothetical protein [Sulfitobacter sp.]
MTSAEVMDEVRLWFEASSVASMELPDGWFGRPHDNMHRLTWFAVRDDKLIIELDGQLHLIAAGAELVERTATQIALSCRHCTFDWREYGTTAVNHGSVYSDGGVIRLHAHA